MKRYRIIDNQFPDGQGWWLWTKDEPLTKKELLDLFRSYAEDDEIDLPKNKKDFNFDFIQDLWECTIVEMKGAKNESNNK